MFKHKPWLYEVLWAVAVSTFKKKCDGHDAVVFVFSCFVGDELGDGGGAEQRGGRGRPTATG